MTADPAARAAESNPLLARRLRSWMFVPASNQRFLDKVYEMATSPDAVFFDLEDGVVPREKGAARQRLAQTFSEARPGPLRVVRVNPPGTEWFREDALVARDGAEAVCVPKVEGIDDVVAVRDVLGDAIPIVAAIESPLGLLRAFEIAHDAPGVAALMLGTEDYALDLGLPAAREGEARTLSYARAALANAAAAAGALSIDGVFPDLDNEEGLAADIRLSREYGFTGKSTFNPRQIPAINAGFDPSEKDLEYARTVVQAFHHANARGDGAVAIGGQLVDLPIVLRAMRTIEACEGVSEHG